MRKLDLYTRTNQIVLDGLIYSCAFFLAYVVRFEGLFRWDFGKQFLIWLPYLVAIRLYLNWRLGIYRQIWRYISLDDAIAVASSLSIPTLVLLSLRLFYPVHLLLAARFRLPLSVIVMEFLFSLAGSAGVRALRRVLYLREALRASGNGPVTRVLLVGAGRAGLLVAKQLIPRQDVRVVGFLDDDPRKIGADVIGVRVLGPVASLASLVVKHRVEEVVICIPRPARATLKRLWALCEGLPVRARIVPTLEEILQGKVSISAFRDLQMEELLGRETVELSSDLNEAEQTYRGKRILVTGAGGSIGSELVNQLFQFEPQELVLLDRDENGLFELYSQIGNGSCGAAIHAVVADIRFPERLKAIFSRFRPEVVFHAAAHKHVPLMELNPCEAIVNNVTGTRNLVEQALDHRAEVFVLISTDKAVKPSSVMGASKRICEMMVQVRSRRASTKFSCVRFGNVMGSRASVIPLFRKQIAKGGPLTVTHADVQRFLMTIPEAVRLVIRAGTLASRAEIFVLDMGDPIPIIDLARDLIELSGLRPDHDVRIETVGLRQGEKMVEELIDAETETVTPTRFDKIRVVSGGPINAPDFETKLAALEQAARREDPNEVLRCLAELEIGYAGTLGRESLRPHPLAWKKAAGQPR